MSRANTADFSLQSERTMERLTALWALNEAGMGGLIHAMKIPFTGIVVAAIAVILISTIGFFANRKSAAILRATMVVLLVKAAASPHTPIPAYIAVLFQGAMGAFLYGVIPWPRLAAFLLALFALWQGALQKLIVMTLIYGRPLWDSVDLVGRRLFEWLGVSHLTASPTAWFLLLYMSYYTIGGLITGWLAACLPAEISHAAARLSDMPTAPPVTETSLEVRPKPWWRRPPAKAGLAAVLLSAVLILLSPSGSGVVHGLRLLIRATAAIALWMLVMRPLAQRGVQWFQRREQSRYAADVSRTMHLLPSMRAAAMAAWSRARGVRGFRRWRYFFVDLVARALVE